MTFLKPFVVLLLIFPVSLTGQNTDSLENVLDTAKNQYRVKALNEMFRTFLPSDPVKALGYAREALSYGSEVGDKKGIAAAYNNLGVAYRIHGSLDKALNYYISALHIYEELNNKEGIASSKNNIATLYSVKKDFPQALKYLEESNTVFNELNDEEKIIGSLNNLGNIYTEMQMYEKALQYYTDAYNRSEKAGKSFGDPLNNIGNLHFRQKDYPLAIEYYEKALIKERESNNKNAMLNVLTNLAVTYTKSKQSKKAEAYLNEAFSLCNEIQAYSYLPTLYKTQAENLALMGNMNDAYETQLKYDEAREMIFGEESTRNIAQMELRLAFHEKEKELDILRKEDEIKTLELKNTRLIVIMIILTGMVTVGILNYVFLSKKKILKKRPS
jgi:tetratricopeptide (TPR) repeat protein